MKSQNFYQCLSLGSTLRVVMRRCNVLSEDKFAKLGADYLKISNSFGLVGKEKLE